MFDFTLYSVLDSGLTLGSFIACSAVSLGIGIGIALINRFRSQCSQSFALTLAILPAIVQTVIMLVNGNIGAGVAVAGAFSLVRFRSVPGTAKEILSIFLAMAVGLAAGMGYLILAVLFFLIIAIAMLLLTASGFGDSERAERLLKITIPEDLDYDGLFDDLFQIYTKRTSLEKVKTSNLGTLYELQYRITLREDRVPKEFLDAIRCRNGNLNIVCAKAKERDLL